MNWGKSIALVYGAFACSTVGFAVFAMSQPVDLVSADYYDRALHQDQRMAAIANTRALGDALAVTPDVTARRLTIAMPALPAPAQGTVTLYRPSDAAADRAQPLALDHGTQVVPLDDLPRGRWIVKVEWTAGEAPYYYEAPFQMP